MEKDAGLKWRLMVTAILAVGLFVYFVERMSHRSVAPRNPASAPAKVLPACEDSSCLPSTDSDRDSSRLEEGQVFRAAEES